MARARTPQQKAEAALTRYALSLPETDLTVSPPPVRYLRVAGRGFAVFGAAAEAADALTVVVKLPVSAGMVEGLPFVQPATGWRKKHDWVTARFTASDDILAELETLKGWILQSYRAMAPKRLAKLPL